jgi:hypothetical protein
MDKDRTAICEIISEKQDITSDVLRAVIEKAWHLVGYYHKAETADECDFYFLDAINGDCPDCHPCYADTAALEKPAPQGSGLPLSIKDTTHDEKDWHYVNDRLEKAEREVARLKAACDKMSKDEMLCNSAALVENQKLRDQVTALEPDATRYRLGREAEYAGLMPTIRTGKTWAEAMDAAYDAAIEAARKGTL